MLSLSDFTLGHNHKIIQYKTLTPSPSMVHRKPHFSPRRMLRASTTTSTNSIEILILMILSFEQTFMRIKLGSRNSKIFV